MDQILKDIVAIIEALGTSGLAAAIVAVITSRWGGLKQTPQTVPTVPPAKAAPQPTPPPAKKKPLPPHGG